MPYIDAYRFTYGPVWTGRSLFWVGGTATWDSTAGTKWSLTSGGVGGEPIPTVNDDVYFDINSGAVSVTTSTFSVARNAIFAYTILVAGVPTDMSFTGTFKNTQSLQLYGSLTLSALMTIESVFSNPIVFLSTSLGNTITTAGIPMIPITLNGVGGYWTLQDIFESGSKTYTITLTNGTFDTGSQVVGGTNGISFSSDNTNIRSLILGTSTWYIPGGGVVTNWNISDPTNFTLDAGDSTISVNSNPTFTFNGGTLNYGDLICTSISAGIVTLNQVNNFQNLDFEFSSSVSSGAVYLGADQNVSGTFTANGNGLFRRGWIRSDVRGTPRTITAGSVVATYMDFQDIVGSGAGWDLSAITGNSGDCGGNSGITFTPAANQYWVAAGGTSTGNTLDNTHIASSSGGVAGTGRVPLPQDILFIDGSSINAAGKTVTIQFLRTGSVNCTGVTNTPTISMTGSGGMQEISGSIIFDTAMTFVVAGHTTFTGRGAQSFKTAGLTWNSQIWLDSVTGSYTQLDNLTCSSGDFISSSSFAAYTLISGTWNTGIYSLILSGGSWLQTGGTFTDGGGGVTALVITNATGTGKICTMAGTWTATSTGTVWNFASAGLTLNAGASTISCTNTSGTAKTFAGAGLVYNDISVAGAAGAGTFTITGSNTFHSPTFAANSNIKLTTGTTQTITGAITATGTAGNLVTIASTTGTNATISSAGNETWDYTSLTNLTGTGGGTFTATHSTDGGGNVGITITP